MVVLHKLIRQAQCLELIFTKGFHEETAAILKNIRHKHKYISQGSRLYSYLHNRVIVLLAKVEVGVASIGAGLEQFENYLSSTRSGGLTRSSGSSPFSASRT